MGRVRLFNVVWAGAFVLLLAGLAWYVGWARVTAALRGADPSLLLVALVAYFAFFVARGLRWQLLLRDVAPALDVRTATGLTAGAWLISTFVPLKAGDITRAAVVARRERASLLAVGGTVAIERALDVVGLAVLASVGLAAVALFAPEVPPLLGEALMLAWILPLIGLALLGLAARHVPHDHPNMVLRFAARFLAGIRSLRAQPRRIPVLAVLTVAATVCQSLVFSALVLALRPATSWAMATAASPLFLLSFAFAVTPGHVGTYEAAFVFVYGLIGIPAQELMPMAVACHLLSISLVAVLGTIGLASLRAAPLAAPPPTPLEEPTP